MRDLGRLGENTFAMWCAQVALNANPSLIDNAGWDYYVEFPISQNLDVNELHKSAINCKVQIKSTDKSDRKLSITLSNLRQMATSQMPSFYVFLEFNGENEVQKAFVLHLDNTIIYSILKKIHEIEQSDKVNNLNKRTMTLHYDDSHELSFLNGQSLKEKLLTYIGEDYSKYLTEKADFLKTCGFEDGFGKCNFTIEGDDGGLTQLIDLSLGLIDEIDVKNIVNIDERFGIPSKKPSFELENAKLKIGLQTPKKGTISFKKDKFSRALLFYIEFYNSPFNFYDYRKYTKFRIIGDFFDMTCEPYAGKTNYSLTLGGNQRLELKKLKDALALIHLMSSKDQTAIVELRLENLEPLVFDFKSKFVKRDLKVFNEIIIKLLNIFQKFEIYDDIYISLNELYQNKQHIEQFHIIMTKTVECDFKVDFELSSNHIFKFKKVASISVFYCRVGSHILGAIVTAFGVPQEISKNKFKIDKVDLKIEKTFSYTSETMIKNDDILQLIENISSSYLERYDVFYNWGK